MNDGDRHVDLQSTSTERLAVVIVSHPNPNSFNHALAARSAKVLSSRRRAVTLRDLYGEGFDPLLPVEELDTTAGGTRTSSSLVLEHQDLLSRAETVVMIHPNWWGKPPAMAAGWIDRVLAPGVAYRLSRRDATPLPLLALRHLVVLNTSDTLPLREAEVFGDPLEAMWARCVGQYIPRAVFTRRVFAPVGASTPRDRRGWLDELGDLLPE